MRPSSLIQKDGEGNSHRRREEGDGQWRVAGEGGIPLVVTVMGETMQQAREQVYGRIDDILMPNMYYRDDIGERWIDGDGDRLQAWGYLGP